LSYGMACFGGLLVFDLGRCMLMMKSINQLYLAHCFCRVGHNGR
jgi:hypothetical protein